MKTIKTTTDSWECIPELNEVAEILEQLNNPIYEIKNCQRASDLDSMINSMREYIQEAEELLSQIDTDVEIVEDHDYEN